MPLSKRFVARSVHLVVFLYCIIAQATEAQDPCSTQEPCLNVSFGEKHQDGNRCVCCVECMRYKRKKIRPCASSWQECGGCLYGHEELNSESGHDYCIKSKKMTTLAMMPHEDHLKEAKHYGEHSALTVAIVIPVVGVAFIFSAVLFLCKQTTARGSYALAPNNLIHIPKSSSWGIEMKEMSREVQPLVNGQTSIRIPEEREYEEDAVLEESHKSSTIEGYIKCCEDQKSLKAVPIDINEFNPYATFQIGESNTSTQPPYAEITNNADEHSHLTTGHSSGIANVTPNIASGIDDVPIPSCDSGYNTYMNNGDLLGVDEGEDSEEGMSFGSGYSSASTAVVGDDTLHDQHSCRSPQAVDDNDCCSNSKSQEDKTSEASASFNTSSDSVDHRRVSVNMEVSINFHLQS